jgi:hypothetical protein
MQPAPGRHGDGAVLVVDGGQGGSWDRPGGWVGAVELGAVAPRPASLARWWGWWVGIEAAVRAQPDQHRHRRLGELQGELGGVVAGVKDEQRHGPAGRETRKQRMDLRGGGLVGVGQGMQPAGVHWGGPGIAVEAELGDPLPGPAGDDRPAGWREDGSSSRAPGALGVTTRPGGHIDREHRRVAIGQVAGEQVTQPLGVDPTAGQRGIGAAQPRRQTGSRLRCGSDPTA